MLKTFNILDSVPINPYKEGFPDIFFLWILQGSSLNESYQFLQTTTLNQQSVTYGSV